MDQATAMDIDSKNTDPGTELSFLVTQCRIAVGDLNLSQELIETGVATNDLDMVKNELKDLNKCMDDLNAQHMKLVDFDFCHRNKFRRPVVATPGKGVRCQWGQFGNLQKFKGQGCKIFEHFREY